MQGDQPRCEQHPSQHGSFGTSASRSHHVPSNNNAATGRAAAHSDTLDRCDQGAHASTSTSISSPATCSNSHTTRTQGRHRHTQAHDHTHMLAHATSNHHAQHGALQQVDDAQQIVQAACNTKPASLQPHAAPSHLDQGTESHGNDNAAPIQPLPSARSLDAPGATLNIPGVTLDTVLGWVRQAASIRTPAGPTQQAADGSRDPGPAGTAGQGGWRQAVGPLQQQLGRARAEAVGEALRALERVAALDRWVLQGAGCALADRH